MQISSSAFIGVESLVRLTACGADTPCTTQGLAELINRSVSYTEKILARLREAGLVKAKRGRGGGYSLARSAHRITVAEIFRAFDEPHGLPERPLDAVGFEAGTIGIRRGTDLLWESLKSDILLFLNGVSLADIAPQTAGRNGSDGSDPFHAAMQSTVRN